MKRTITAIDADNRPLNSRSARQKKSNDFGSIRNRVEPLWNSVWNSGIWTQSDNLINSLNFEKDKILFEQNLGSTMPHQKII
jgi:hypothetical protein